MRARRRGSGKTVVLRPISVKGGEILVLFFCAFFHRSHNDLTAEAEENGATDADARTSGGKPSGWAV